MSLPSSLKFWLVVAIAAVAGRAGAATVDDPAGARPTAPQPAITTVAEAFARWPDLAIDDLPVQLTGVVTGTMPNGAFRMHDGHLGIYAAKSPAGQKITPGDRIEVSGFLRKGGYSPWITPQKITVTGRSPFPEAPPATFSLLESGVADNQWVEVEGVVQSVQVPEPRDFAVLDLGMAGGNLRVLVNHEDGRSYESLINAAVRMRGVAAVNVNKHHHVVEPSFRVPTFSEITVLTPGPADPFSGQLVPLRSVMKFSPGVITRRHRVMTRGVVLRRLSETTLFVRDEGLGLKVETEKPVSFGPGDLIEAVGFPVMADGMAVLDHSIARLIHPSEAPQPLTPSVVTLLDGSVNSDLVKIRARLVDWVVAGQNATLIFESGGQLFKGLFNLRSANPDHLPPENSVVNVTGICVISELEDLWFYQPRSFMVLVAQMDDIELVAGPPWWTAGRLWWALAISCSVLLAAVGWVWALRRQIERKRSVIVQQARHAAALEERNRIARELHDTLEQGLTGLSLQMKAMDTDLEAAPHPARSRLFSARQMLRQSRALARNAIRELRTDTAPVRVEGLVEGLKHVADEWNASGALAVDVLVIGDPRVLPPRVEHHLLRIGTEAMTNAVKHGRADTIQVGVEFRAANVTVRIKDNGVGFRPAAHLESPSGCFGLVGMRERAREVRGELAIQSQPGAGTEVSVTAPTESGDAIEGVPETAVTPAPLASGVPVT